MTREQRKLEEKFLPAVIAINIACEFCCDNDANHIVKRLAEARETFFKLHEDWRRHLGDPVEVKPAVIARELRRLADRIEAEDEQ